jgi:hypothetical protein
MEKLKQLKQDKLYELDRLVHIIPHREQYGYTSISCRACLFKGELNEEQE